MSGPSRKTKSSKEHDEIIDFVVLLLDRRQKKTAIKKAVNDRFFRENPVSSRSIERYLSRARERIVEASGKTKEQHRLEAIAFYESVITGPDADLKERMHAQELLVDLLGIALPKPKDQVEISGSLSVESVTLTSAERSSRILEILEAGRQRLGATGSGLNGCGTEGT